MPTPDPRRFQAHTPNRRWGDMDATPNTYGDMDILWPGAPFGVDPRITGSDSYRRAQEGQRLDMETLMRLLQGLGPPPAAAPARPMLLSGLMRR